MRGAPLEVRENYVLLMEHLRQWNSSSVKYDSAGIMVGDTGAVGAVQEERKKKVRRRLQLVRQERPQDGGMSRHACRPGWRSYEQGEAWKR